MTKASLMGLCALTLVVAVPAFADNGRAPDSPAARMPEPVGFPSGTSAKRFTASEKHALIEERMALKRQIKREIKDAKSDEEREALLAEQKQVEREISAILAS